jgi:hypothetical protein
VRLTRKDRVRTGNETRGEVKRHRGQSNKVGLMRGRWVERLFRPGSTRGKRKACIGGETEKDKIKIR